MLGRTLKKLRGIYGYSAREMSSLLRISSSYLSEIENGKKEPSLLVLQRFADVFGLKMSTLLRFSEQYECAEKEGKGQFFITELMGRIIDSFSREFE